MRQSEGRGSSGARVGEQLGRVKAGGVVRQGGRTKSH